MKFLKCSLAILVAITAHLNASNSAQKPNIVLLLADDLGYNEIGAYGQKMFATPHMDTLAAKGIRFTDFYSGNAVCSPSRAVLMTGKSSTQINIRGNSGYYGDGQWLRVPLAKEDLTMAEMLKAGGYQTVFVGKWHLDDPNDVSTWAAERGFDFALQEQWSSRAGGRKFQYGKHWINGDQESIQFNLEDWQSKDEFYTENAFKFIDQLDTEQPFFIFMSYRAPHGSERKIGNNTLYTDRGWPEKQRVHASKITILDEQIGRLIDKLEAMGELDNTLILLTSDNGPHKEGNNPNFFDSNGVYRGIKRDVYEGGIRVPLIAFWDGKITAGTVTQEVAGFQDLLPTVAEAVGLQTPAQSDGRSILSTLQGDEQTDTPAMVWEFQLDGQNRAMKDGGFRQSARIGKWKAVRYGIKKPTQLYDLTDDPGEATDLAQQFPEVVERMEQLFATRIEAEHFPFGGVVKSKRAPEKPETE